MVKNTIDNIFFLKQEKIVKEIAKLSSDIL